MTTLSKKEVNRLFKKYYNDIHCNVLEEITDGSTEKYESMFLYRDDLCERLNTVKINQTEMSKYEAAESILEEHRCIVILFGSTTIEQNNSEMYAMRNKYISKLARKDELSYRCSKECISIANSIYTVLVIEKDDNDYIMSILAMDDNICLVYIEEFEPAFVMMEHVIKESIEE